MAFSTVAVLAAVIGESENIGSVPPSPNDGNISIIETTHMDVLLCIIVATKIEFES
jgi:hypothetical protein